MLNHSMDPLCPARQSYLAPEVYLEILSYLRPLHEPSNFNIDLLAKHNLCNTVLVCKFFYQVASNWRFEELFLDEANYHISNTERLYCPDFLEQIMTDQSARSAALLVKKCYIRSAHNHRRGLEYSEYFYDLCYSALPHMINIQQLFLEGVYFTRPFLKMFQSWAHLEGIRLLDCWPVKKLTRSDCHQLWRIKFQYIEIVYTSDDDDLEEYSDDVRDYYRLEKFLSNIDYGLSKYVKTNLYICYKKLYESNTLQFRHLTALDIGQLNHTKALKAILQCTPYLIYLRVAFIGLIASHVKEPTHLDPNIATSLEIVDIPFSILEMIAPGRPIRIATVTCDEFDRMGSLPQSVQPEIRMLEASTGCISQLRVPVTFYLEVPFAERFVDLRILEIYFFCSKNSECPAPSMFAIEQTISIVMEAWPQQPSLITLTFDFGILDTTQLLFNLKIQHYWLTWIVAPRIPSLRHCRFCSHVQWNYSSTGWYVSTVSKNCKYTLAYLLREGITKIEYVDYQGCFARLLGSY